MNGGRTLAEDPVPQRRAPLLGSAANSAPTAVRQHGRPGGRSVPGPVRTLTCCEDSSLLGAVVAAAGAGAVLDDDGTRAERRSEARHAGRACGGRTRCPRAGRDTEPGGGRSRGAQSRVPPIGSSVTSGAWRVTRSIFHRSVNTAIASPPARRSTSVPGIRLSASGSGAITRRARV